MEQIKKRVITIDDIEIDIRADNVLYVTIGDWVVYIDDSTNERIISSWED